LGLSALSGAAPAGRVLAWWLPSEIRQERDQLPWRSPAVTPWGVLVSETMLAQTQVGRVAERYGPFMERFASPQVVAAEPLGALLRAWQGLGYPRRAANLHRSAAAIVAEHAGEVPSDLGSLLALPGVGRYTARAVRAFAFDAVTMPVDTNIGRVLARLAGRRLRESEAQSLGDALAAAHAPVQPEASGGRATALAFMDLGATLCLPSAPRCPECPLREVCSWGSRSLTAPGSRLSDPARGSARVSKSQPPFEGSDRQGRGRLLRAAAAAPFTAGDVAAAAGWPGDPERAAAAAASLVADGLLCFEDGSYRLP